jgi:diguanylate cyclase (GGDEF)-like protein
MEKRVKKIKTKTLSNIYKKSFLLLPIAIGLGFLFVDILFETTISSKRLNEEIAEYEQTIQARIQDEVQQAIVITNYYYQAALPYESDEKIKEHIILLLEQLNSKDVGYFFAADYNGNTMIGPAKGNNVYDIEDKNGLKVVQKLISTAQEGGGFVEYIMPPIEGVDQAPKISYVLPFEPYQWYIGAGVLLSEIQTIRDKIQQNSFDKNKSAILVIGLIIMVNMLLLSYANSRLYRKISLQINSIYTYLKEVTSRDILLDTRDITIEELKRIGDYASNMVQKRIQDQALLNDQYKQLQAIAADLEMSNASLEEEINEHNQSLLQLQKSQSDTEYLSYHDQLTGIFNRRYFDEQLIRLDSEKNLPLAIAMVDVNGLKLTNDAFGHQTGDMLLKNIAIIIEEQLSQEEEFVARIGGDEFVIICPKSSEEKIESMVKNIYTLVQHADMVHSIVSVSIGWEVKHNRTQNLIDVFAHAEEHMYRKKLIESQSMRNQTVQVILKTLNEKNSREKIHSDRVSHLCKLIGEALNMDYESIKELESAGLLHDIGKITVDEKILNKEGKLTEEEFTLIKKHPESSYQILKSIDAYAGFAENVLSHHERWDGNGYPRGLKGKEISLIARIITLADSFEAMTADRAYRKAQSKDYALMELKKYAGSQFDPALVDLFEEKVYPLL